MSHSSSQRSPSKTRTALAVLACCFVAASSTEIDQRARIENVFNRKGLRRKNNAAHNVAHDGLYPNNNRRLIEYDGKIKLGPVHEEVDIYEKAQQPKEEDNDDKYVNANNSDQQPQQTVQQQAKPQEKKTGGHVEYDGKLVLGPAHEEVDIYETKSTNNNNNNVDGDRDEDDLRQETDKLKADLAKLVELDDELKQEISEFDPDEMMVTAQVEAEDAMMTDSPTAAPPGSSAQDDLAKLKAELAKLEDLDTELKDAIHDEQMQELQKEREKLDNDLGQLQQLDDELKEDMKEERDQELEDEVTKLKNDLANLEELDGQLKEEMAEKDKPGKEEHIANLQNAEAAVSNNPNPNLIDKDERTAIDLATALENSIAACDAAAAIQPPNTQRVDSTPASTEAQLEINYEEACCVPPLYDSYCTPTQTREWCDMRLKCLEADRLGTVFLSKVEEEIASASKDCEVASGEVGNNMRTHKIEEKCCMPPYDELLPPCIDREERQRRREENKCDGGLERCVEVEMLKDLRDDTIGLPFEEYGNAGSSGVAGSSHHSSEDDKSTPNVADSYHMNVADGDEGYAYANHIGGRDKGGKKSFAYKKKEEFRKEDYYALGGGSASRPAAEDSGTISTTAQGFIPALVLMMVFLL